MPKLCRFLTGQERDCGVCSDHTGSKGMYIIMMVLIISTSIMDLLMYVLCSFY